MASAALKESAVDAGRGLHVSATRIAVPTRQRSRAQRGLLRLAARLDGQLAEVGRLSTRPERMRTPVTGGRLDAKWYAAARSLPRRPVCFRVRTDVATRTHCGLELTTAECGHVA